MVQWWDEWELRTLVLASLSAQYLLVLLAAVRKFRIPTWLGLWFRLLHIGSDALAILALATLFNRQKNGPGCHYARGSRNLELLWAPILVMHLGGQVAITTYKIEDNEQWGRHILTSLSKFEPSMMNFLLLSTIIEPVRWVATRNAGMLLENGIQSACHIHRRKYSYYIFSDGPVAVFKNLVTVALYVLYKSWSADDKRLLAATILLFILVIIRSFQKALNLKCSSFDALRKANLSEKNVIRGSVNTEEVRLTKFIREAKKVVHMGEPKRSSKDQELPWLPYQLFLDFPCPYSNRVEILKKFWLLQPEFLNQAIERVLSSMTSFLYTKDDITLSPMTSFLYTKDDITLSPMTSFPRTIDDITLSPMTSFSRTIDCHAPYHAFKNAPSAAVFRRCTQALAYATLIAAICLVHTSSHRKARSGEDTWVTLVLLYGALVLELVYFWVQKVLQDQFSGGILQHSIIGLLANNRWRHYTLRLRMVAGWFQCKDLVDQYFTYMESSDSCKEITELVRQHVELAWKDYIHDNETYRRFNDARGEWTLARKKCLRKLGWSIMRPFDETIILWHLATDLCFQYMAWSPDDRQCASRCKVISNYMMHLLFANPEMLMPGSRKSLFTKAYDELKDIDTESRDEKEFIERAIDICKQGYTADSFIHDAWELAEFLSGDELDGDDHGEATKRWELIQGVWVEMLCFSAGRCRGYLHAQTLGGGVEYLSYVWVLVTYAGMETFPEKLQRREGQTVDGYYESLAPRGREDPAAAAATSPSETEDLAHVALDLTYELED